MSRRVQRGNDWSAEELDAIIADYFGMLRKEIVGAGYVKSKHNAALQEEIARSPGSIEYKHQNISAVLEQLGLPWIDGYKPMRNFQRALVSAIERYLDAHPEVLTPRAERRAPPEPPDAFVPTPPRRTGIVPGPLQELVNKFDPVERDFRNRELGRAGEEFVLGLERQKLKMAGLPALSRDVRWISREEGDGAGFDIRSFDLRGNERLIEVKTTNGSARTPFFLSRREHDVSARQPEKWRIYRVHLFATTPRIFELAPPVESVANLRTETWRVSF